MLKESSDKAISSKVINNKNYDPTHPDADWSGFVSTRSQRKHVTTRPNQICALNGEGLAPNQEVPTAEWIKPARKMANRAPSCADNVQSSTFSLIGGPVPAVSPGLYSPRCWETEAQAAARKRKTDLEQLTYHGRSIYVNGKKRCNPIIKGAIEANTKDHNLKSQICVPSDPSDFLGFRSGATKISYSDPEFLKGVSDGIEKMGHSPAPFATDNSAIFDPYRTATGERRKDLLVENFRSTVPGYTGRRTFIK